jgi:hypothetical protein
MAPELLTQGLMTRASDCYSYGVILLELYYGSTIQQLLTGRSSTAGSGVGGAGGAGAGAGTSEVGARALLAGLPEGAFTQLVGSCMRQEAEERPTFAEVARRIEEQLAAGLGV